MIRRHVTGHLNDALIDRPVVLLHGARQVGKTTLVRDLAATNHPARYVTFDSLPDMAAATDDPAGFLAGIDGPLVLDEVQKVPDLFVAIKAAADRKRQPGRFLLTGSANVLLLPTLSESLAGRMEIVTLWPLSQGEIDGVREGFVDAAFGAAPPTTDSETHRNAIVDRIVRGGYPEPVAMTRPDRRHAWFESYLASILSRDVRDLASIERLTVLPHLIAILAGRPMALLNYAELGRTAGLPQSTLKRYFTLLETVFLVRTLRPWHVSVGKRLVKSPKVMLTDSGLAAYLVGADAAALTADRNRLGGLLEAFVAMEIIKQQGWSKTRPALYHFRTHSGDEVDLVLESRSGTLVGIEVKSTANVSSSDFRGLRELARLSGDRFHRGLVLYTGLDVVPFGQRLHAIPIESLWCWGAKELPTRA